MKNRFGRFALRTSLLYALVAGLWILLSDRLLTALVSNREMLMAAQTYKGWGFVAVTALLLYVLVRTQLLRGEKEVAARRLAQERLRESEMRFRQFSEISTEGIILHSHGVINDTNTALARMFGYQPEELIGMDPLQLVAEESREALARGLAGDAAAAMEATGLRKDGTSFPLEVEPRSYLARGGEMRFVCCRDITERKRLETERVDLQRQLLHTQKLESLGVLAGGIAHDFNNLLMAVHGNLELARAELPAPSPGRASLERAIHATRRAADLTRAMLAYSGKGRFEVSRVDLNDLVRENADLFRSAVARNVTLSLSLTDLPAMIEADTGQVQQVIMNLITNASEAISDAPGEIRITTALMERDTDFLGRSRTIEKPLPGLYACLEVTDTGRGMDEATLQRLFDPFFTTKFTGRGLGMSAVLGIVRGHKGAIMVDSVQGRGTTVHVLFPAVGAAAAQPAASSDRPEEAAGVSLSGMVLVVDDEKAVRDVGIALVSYLGFKPIGAADGEEALQLFEAHGEELAFVLLDMTMPRMDGITALREMKRRRPDARVILCSGFGEQDAAERSSVEGAAGFIQKPYGLEQLKTAILAVLGPPS
jgi:two-component system cell cycle sensor histidine kinase/response regulator CckA